MKTLLSILLLSFTLFLLCCHKKEPPQPQLPPATQTGAGTFGCKINGQIDTANYADNFGAFATYLHLVYPPEYSFEDGYFLTVHGEKRNKWGITLKTDSLQIYEDSTYTLGSHRKGTAYAIYLNYPGTPYYTQDSLEGKMTITKIDETNQIISGTFWFDAIDTITEEKVQVRDGRFDLLYTK
ncbi:MAG: DUF6252 family protein [Chitinophagaceae bacterium]